MSKIILDPNDTISIGAGSSDTSIYGGSGSEKVIVAATAGSIYVSQSVERTELSGASTAYSYLISGNNLLVKSGATTVATIIGGAGTKTIAFSDGSAPFAVTGVGVATLGGQSISASTAGTLIIPAAQLNTSDKSASAPVAATPIPSAVQTFTLTTGIDNITGTTGDDSILATDGGWTALDAVNGGLGNNTFLVAQAANLAKPAGATISNIQTLTLMSGGTVTGDYSSNDLTTLNITSGTGTTVTAKSTTNVNELTSVSASSITGGKDVVVTHTGSAGITVSNNGTVTATSANGTSAAGAITVDAGTSVTATTRGANVIIGNTTPVTGAVVVNDTVLAGHAIVVKGGTAVNITATGATSGTIDVGGTSTNAPSGNVTISNTGTAVAGALSVQGGANVSITETGVSASTATIAVGAVSVGAPTLTLAPTGSVTISQTSAYADDGNGDNQAGTTPAILVNGGTTVDITAIQGVNAAKLALITAPATSAANTTTITNGLITVNGSSVTSTVKVTQAAAQSAADAVTGVAGTPTSTGSTITAVTAVAGKEAVAALTAVNKVTAVTGKVGIVDSVVTIVDKNYNTTSTNSIATVELNNYAATSVIKSNVLSSLTLSGTAGTLTITNATDGSDGVPTTTNTTLNLRVNGLNNGKTPALTGSAGIDNTITDTNNEYTTINVVTTGADSIIRRIDDTALTTLNVSGDHALTIDNRYNSAYISAAAATGAGGSLTSASPITKITVSGSASYIDSSYRADFALPSLATFTTTSSGEIKAPLNATVTAFTGSTGKATIMIDANTTPTKSITGGSSTSDELILDGGHAQQLGAGWANGSPSAQMIAGAVVEDLNGITESAWSTKLTGFEVLGVSNSVYGTLDMSKLASSFNQIHVINTAGKSESGLNVGFSNVATGTTLSIDGNTPLIATGATGRNGLTTTYALASAGGSSKSITVNLGDAVTDSFNFGTLILKDINNNGIGSVNLVSNGVDVTAGDATPNYNTVVVANTDASDIASDTKLINLNVSGTQGLVVTSLDDAVTSLTINNTNTGKAGLTVSTLTDNSLDSLTFAGTGKTTITALADTAANVELVNTGTGSATVGWTTSTLANLTLTGNVALTLADTIATKVTINGATNNAHLDISTDGIADSITLGNGNNVISTGTGADTIVAGSGMDSITGGIDADVLTGGLGADLFVYNDSATELVVYAGSDTTSANIEQIKDFVAGTDKIKLITATTFAGLTVTAGTTGVTVNESTFGVLGAAPIAITDNLTAGSDTLTALTALFETAASGIASTTGAAAAATGLQAYTFAVTGVSGFAGHTYLVINDGTAALAATDVIIDITGVSGNISASDFVIAV